MIKSELSNVLTSTSKVLALVEFYEGSTLVTTCTCSDALQGFTVERYGEDGKFFGTCITQTIKMELIDLYKNLNINETHRIRVAYEIEGIRVYPYPSFYITEFKRNEKDNTISIVATDALGIAERYSFADLQAAGLSNDNYSIRNIIVYCGTVLGLVMGHENIALTDPSMSVRYFNGANFSKNESLKEILKQVCEATQCICYATGPLSGGGADRLILKRLDRDGEPLLTITKNDYFDLTTQPVRTLQGICHATELGNNLTSPPTALEEGSLIQYVRSNPFWEAVQNVEGTGDTDLAALIDTAVTTIGGISITPFHCDWAGYCLLEIGDKIALTTNDDSTVISYVLNNTVSFDGIYNEILEWSYEENASETDSNPTDLGEILNQTFAKVDKSAQTIELVVSKAAENESNITALRLDVDSIVSTVEQLDNFKDEDGNFLGQLAKKSEIEQTATDVSIEIFDEKFAEKKESGEIEVDKVTTTTGFKFDKDGLNISKSSSDISTQITENGMTVSKGGTGLLKADSSGVKAQDLHATTFLLIGENSRLQDYGTSRTGCFWIGY